ncbi:MAG: putative extracellular nuclease [Bacteroidia bacterium]|jgi:predicted extracellular nuclease
MKRTLLSIAFTAAASSMIAQDCSELFISEYVVGSGNNRALELYNPTANSIDLSTYKVGRFRDGSGTPMLLDLSGTIASLSTFVIVIDKQDPNGTGFDEPVDAALAAVADIFVNPVYVQSNSPFYFNGDDAVPLFNGDASDPSNLKDVVGRIGEDPGTAWSDANGTWWTTDKTLIRKASVLSGDGNGLDEFLPEVQWDSLPENTFTELGWHTCDCADVGVNDQDINRINVYPNPNTTRILNVSANKNIDLIQVFNIIGQEAKEIDLSNQFADTQRLDLKGLKDGLYIVRVTLDGGATISRKITLQK